MKGLNIGDTLYRSTRHGLSKHGIARITKTQYVLDSGDRVRKHDLEPVGESDRFLCLHYLEPTEELDQEYLLESLKRQVSTAITNIDSIVDRKELDTVVLSELLKRLNQAYDFIKEEK